MAPNPTPINAIMFFSFPKEEYQAVAVERMGTNI